MLVSQSSTKSNTTKQNKKWQPWYQKIFCMSFPTCQFRLLLVNRNLSYGIQNQFNNNEQRYITRCQTHTHTSKHTWNLCRNPLYIHCKNSSFKFTLISMAVPFKCHCSFNCVFTKENDLPMPNTRNAYQFEVNVTSVMWQVKKNMMSLMLWDAHTN